MTTREKALLFSPPIVGLVIALSWAVVGKVTDVLDTLGRRPTP